MLTKTKILKLVLYLDATFAYASDWVRNTLFFTVAVEIRHREFLFLIILIKKI